MIGFRFSLILDFGVGAAARVRNGVRRWEDSVQRMEEARRAAVSRPVPPPSEDLGWGPLEPENLGGGFSELKHSRGVRR